MNLADTCPIPKPNGDIARAHPFGGWEARHPNRDALPTITDGPIHDRVCGHNGTTTRRPWACTIDQHPDSPWHVATLVGGVVIAVWREQGAVDGDQ